jgi:hypothetical protein
LSNTGSSQLALPSLSLLIFSTMQLAWIIHEA